MRVSSSLIRLFHLSAGLNHSIHLLDSIIPSICWTQSFHPSAGLNHSIHLLHLIITIICQTQLLQSAAGFNRCNQLPDSSATFLHTPPWEDYNSPGGFIYAESRPYHVNISLPFSEAIQVSIDCANAYCCCKTAIPVSGISGAVSFSRMFSSK